MSAAEERRDQPLPARGFVMFAAVVLGWGTAWVFMKLAVNEMAPWDFRAITVSTSGVILLTAARLFGAKLAVPRGDWPMLAVAALFNITGWHVLTAWGLSSMASNRAALIAFTMPVWAALIGILFLGERLTGRRVAALALGVGGLAALLGPGLLLGHRSPAGPGLVFGSALCWATGVQILKRTRWQIPTIVLAGWQLVLGGLPIIAISLALGGPHLAGVSWVALGAAAWTSLIPIAFCTFAWFEVVRLFPISVSSLGTLMIPMMTTVTGAVALGEPLGLSELSGLALITSALSLELLRRR